MSRRILLLVVVLALAATFVVGAAPKKVIYHYHWTETIYDVINTNAVKMFMAKNPDVEVKMVLLPDGDRREHHPHGSRGQWRPSIPSP